MLSTQEFEFDVVTFKCSYTSHLYQMWYLNRSMRLILVDETTTQAFQASMQPVPRLTHVKYNSTIQHIWEPLP